MKKKIKLSLFASLIITLFLPFIQQYFPFITSGALYGFSANAPNTDFSWNTWLEGTYQEKKSKYLNDETGFRPDLIRFNNQVAYSLFKKTNSWDIIEGGNHNLFMASSIDSYYGTDYIGRDAILEKMKKIKALSDTLAHLGKSLILVHSPAKVFMYPEDIPEIRKKKTRAVTNFETYLTIGDSLKINQVDFNTWFCRMKNNSDELLYPRQGGHWSLYASYLAADSLIKYIEKLRNIHIPHPVLTRIEHSTIPREPDNDIAKILNLIFPITKETFSYPEVSYSEDATTIKPKVIYIGDSFLLSWMRDGIMDHTNSDWQIWQWFSILWDKDTNGEISERRIQYPGWIDAINNTDCVVIMYTSFNLPVLGNGFVEQAYNFYYPEK